MRIETYPTFNYRPASPSSGEPVVTGLANGSFLVSWAEGATVTSRGLYAQKFFASGEPAGSVFKLNSGADGQIGNHDVRPLPDGGFLVSWNAPDTANGDIFIRRFGAEGGAPAESVVNTFTAGSQLVPDIASFDDGGFVVAWTSHGQTGANTRGVYLQRYGADGAKLGGETPLAFGQNGSFAPSVTTLVNDDFVVAWHVQEGSYTRVAVQRFSKTGVAYGPATTGELGRGVSDVEALTTGGFVVIERLHDGTTVARLNSSTGVGRYDTIPVSGALATGHLADAVALDGGGFAVVFAEHKPFTGDFDLKVRFFGANGAAEGPAVVVTDSDVGLQIEPTITRLEDGRLAISWFDHQSNPYEAVGSIQSRIITPPGLVTGQDLTTGSEIIVGGAGDDVVLAAPGTLNASDDVYGEAGYDRISMTAAGVLNAAAADLFRIEELRGSAGDDTIVIDRQTLAQGLLKVDGGAGFDTLAVMDSVDLGAFDLVGVERVTHAGPHPATITVESYDQARLVDGTSGAGVKIRTHEAYDAEQRAVLFANGIEAVLNPDSVTYFADGSALAYGAAHRVSAESSFGKTRPAIGALDGGGHVVAWQSMNQDGSGFGIYYQRYDVDGAPVGAEQRANTTTSGNQTWPAVAGVEGGGFVIGWYASNGLIQQMFDASGAPLGGETLVSTTAAALASGQPKFVSLETGGYVAVWAKVGGWFAEQRFDADGVPIGPQMTFPFLERSHGGAYSLASHDLKVAALSDGGHIVMYRPNFSESGGNSGSETHIRIVGPDGTLGPDIRLPHEREFYHLDASLVPLAGGRFLVSWGVFDVYGRIYDATGVSLGDRLILSEAANPLAAGQPKLAALEDGGFALAWISKQTASPLYELVYRTFDAVGSPTSDATVVTTIAQGPSSTNSFTIQALDDGALTFAWNFAAGSIGGRTLVSLSIEKLGGDSDTVVIHDRDTTLLVAPGSLGTGDVISLGDDPDDRLEMTGAGQIDLTKPATFEGVDTIIGSSGDDVISVSDARLEGVRLIEGRGGVDTIALAAPGVLTLRPGDVFTHVEKVRGSSGDDTFVWMNGDFGSLQRIEGGDGFDRIVTSESSLDIRGVTLSGIEALGATYSIGARIVVDSFEKAMLVEGRLGTTVEAPDLTFSSAQMRQIFLKGVDRIVDAAGEHRASVARDDVFVAAEGAPRSFNLFVNNGGAGADTSEVGFAVELVNGQTPTLDSVIGINGGYLKWLGAGRFTFTDTLGYLAGPNSGAVNTSYVTSFEYALAGGGSATATITVNGADSDDVLFGRDGVADTLRGGRFNDQYIVTDASDAVIEGADQGYDRVESSVTFSLAGKHIEALVLTGSAAIDATGNGFDNVLYGNEATNRLLGAGGADTIDGRGGADRMEGGLGNDTYYVDDVSDVVIETRDAGTDIIYSSVTYTLSGRYVEYLGLAGDEAINATGNDLNNTLIGNRGVNVLSGGRGDDVYYVQNTADRVIEAAGQGVDTIYAECSFSLAGQNAENLHLSTIYGAYALSGNALANALTGNYDDNVLNGGAGADVMSGGYGDDAYYVDDAGDQAVEHSGAGTDTVNSSVSFSLRDAVEKLTLTGSAAIDGFGNALQNVVTGNASTNTIDGGAGSDTLRGGGGQDTFRFSTELGAANVDRILDYAVADDTIALDAEIFSGLAVGALGADAFVVGASATQSAHRVIYNSATGALFFDQDGAGGAAAVRFATLGQNLAMTAAEFVVPA